MWEQSGTIRPKGHNMDISPESAVGQAQRDDPFLHASYDRMIAYKYAHGGQGRRSNTVVMIDLDKIRQTTPHGTILDIHSSGGRSQHGISEDDMAAFYARKDAEILIKIRELTQKAGHIILTLDTSQLRYPNRMISDNEAMLLADPAALDYHNIQVQKAFEKTATFTKAQLQCDTIPRDCLIASVDGSRMEGMPLAIAQDLAPQQTFKIATEATMREQHRTARQSLIHLLTGNNGRGGLVWLYWPQDDASWTGTWVLSHACLQRPNSNTRWACVHRRQESDSPAPPGPWTKHVSDLDTETHQEHINSDSLPQSPTAKPTDTYQASQTPVNKEPLFWHHFISCNGRIYKPVMTGRELQNVTCTFFTFPQPGTDIGWGLNLDAVSIANIQEIHDTQTLVSSTAITLTGRQLGTWDFTSTITEPACGLQTATWELSIPEDDPSPTRRINMLPPEMHDIKTFLFNQLGKRTKEMDNLPLRMRRDIEAHLTNIDLQANLLDKMSKTMDTCIVGQQTGAWTGHTVQKWHANLHRHVPGKLLSFSETTTDPPGGSYTIQCSGITVTKGTQDDNRQARTIGRSLSPDIIPASEIAAMIWAMQPFHILKSVLTSNGWQMAKFLKQVTDTPQEALLGTDCKHAPTTCTCFLTQNAHNCTITRATCTLGNLEYQTRLQQQATNTPSPASEQDCPETPFLCISGETFPTAFALNLHIAGAPPGRGHDWTPESRPRLGFNIIIFDPNHPNPFKGMVMALSERATSHDICHEHSTSIEEQAVAAALNTLNRIGSYNAEYIISSDSLACLMAIKNICLSRGQTARRLVRTKEARILIPCQRIIDQLNLRMCDVTLPRTIIPPAGKSKNKRHSNGSPCPPKTRK